MNNTIHDKETQEIDTDILSPTELDEEFNKTDYLDEYDEYEEYDDEFERVPLTVGKVVLRSFIALFSALFLLILGLYLTLLTIARGPSVTVRNMLVLSARQASATKWMPELFLDSDTVAEIYESSDKVTVDVITAEEYANLNKPNNESEEIIEDDVWKESSNGITLKVETGSTFKGYVLLVKDPERVFVGTSSDDYSSADEGMDIFNIVSKYGVVAGINGGEFPDKGGVGTGSRPIGLTYSLGKCVWNDSSVRTFIGFDNNNRLVVSESMTYAEAETLGIRDAVSFQNGNVLINSVDGNVNLHYENSNTGTAQRTAIGQKEDGTVIMIVTDGRTASSLGATHNDMINLMIKYGAVNAAMLDGGSSAMLYCENYYDIFSGFDTAHLDTYQQKGLVNKYQAFSSPRTIPTYFLVKKEVAE